MLAVGTNRGTIILANSRGDKREYNSDGRSGKVFCVALSPEGRTLASGSQDGSLQLWDVMSGEIVRSLRGSSAQGRHRAVAAREGAAGARKAASYEALAARPAQG